MSINPIEIDGGMLEGGGQLLRVTCSIAAIRKQHIIINNIRKNRKNPGLAEQHTVCIKAIGSVCSLDMTNVKVKQITLDFDGTQAISNSSSIIKKFTINGAGSTCLVLQSLLPILLTTPGNHTITIIGGTHALWAPTSDFYEDIFSKYVKHMGIDFHVETKKYGFFPRGGGEIVSQITTPTELKPIYLVERGKGLRIVGKLCYTQNTDLKLAEKCCQSMKKSLRKSIRCNGEPLQCSLDCVKVNGGKCKFIQVYVEFEHCRLSSYVVEERNEGWDSLENRVVERLETEFNHGGCCDEYVQDQLLVIMAITKGHSKISTGEISLHSKTVIELMKMMIGVEFIITKQDGVNIIECYNYFFSFLLTVLSISFFLMQNISDLILKRDAIESRIAQLSEYLNKPEIKGFREVDDEGYPHPDAELIISLRKMKHEYNCLQNDYNDIMETITNELYKIHGESLQYQQSTPSISTLEPLAIIKTVDKDTPADKCGFQEGDIITSYQGYVKKNGNDKPLQMIGSITSQYKGANGIEIEFLRNGKQNKTTMYPTTQDNKVFCGFYIIPY